LVPARPDQEAKMKKVIIILFLFVLFVPYLSLAQEWEKLSFTDKNNDGINDLFRDADGDGKNDLTGKQYRHRFKFEDSDNDGINDLFRDADGDGINDLLNDPNINKKIKNIHHFIDYNRDGINDVTGEKYGRKLSIRTFIDENGDGIDDRETWMPVKSLMGKFVGENDAGKSVMLESMDGPVMDRFIDENGDGINDGRTLNEKFESIDK